LKTDIAFQIINPIDFEFHGQQRNHSRDKDMNTETVPDFWLKAKITFIINILRFLK